MHEPQSGMRRSRPISYTVMMTSARRLLSCVFDIEIYSTSTSRELQMIGFLVLVLT